MTSGQSSKNKSSHKKYTGKYFNAGKPLISEYT